MWLLVVIALQSNPLHPYEAVLSIQPTAEACDAMKLEVLRRTILLYDVPYPLTFRLECKKETL